MTDPQCIPTPELTQEEWRPVVGWEGLYEVSDYGRVRRIVAGGRTWHVPHLLTPVTNVRKYPYVTLCRNSKGSSQSVHRLVAAAFIGPCPTGLQVDHLDGDRTNNRATNLEYVTNRENCRRSVHNGQCGYVKLDQSAAEEIRASSEPGRVLEARYGVSRSTINSVRAGYGWGRPNKGKA